MEKTAELLIDGVIKLDEGQSSGLLSCLCRMVDAGFEAVLREAFGWLDAAP